MFRHKNKDTSKTSAKDVASPSSLCAHKNEKKPALAMVATPIRLAMNEGGFSNERHYVNIFEHSQNNNHNCVTDAKSIPHSHSNGKHEILFKSSKNSSETSNGGVSRDTPQRISKRHSDEDVILRRKPSSKDATYKSGTLESPQRTPSKRSSDNIRRRSSNQFRRISSSDYSRKRSSDPVIFATFAATVASLKMRFGTNSGSYQTANEGCPTTPENPNVTLKGQKVLPHANFGSPNKIVYGAHGNPHQKPKSNTLSFPEESSTSSFTKTKPAPTTTTTTTTPAKKKSPLKGKSIKEKIFPRRKKTDCEAKEEEQVEGSNEKKWLRSSSLRRSHRSREAGNNAHAHLHHHHHHHHHHPHNQLQDPAAHSDTEISKISASHSLLGGECGSASGSVTSERGIDVGRVAAWATSFEKLLEDPAGLHTFAEFLKKEYSHENIYFWTACERYKRLSTPEQLQATAKVIFERHLCSGASEPVNVDSQARQNAQDSLHDPDAHLFSQAQKQIFNLMKFDSYSRFLKSTLYQDCHARDMRGQTLPYPGDETLDPDLRIFQDDAHIMLKKSKSDADERRRKSLLPWHRKDRSKSKDRGEAEYRRQKKMGSRNQSDSSSVRSDMSGSRTSLNSSSDIALGRRAISKESLTSGELGSLSGSEGYSTRCRVILPDLSNSVVAVRTGETVQELLTRLLERRGISYSTFDVYHNKTDKLIDKNEESVALGGLEVRIEQRILFRLDLPNRKTVCVKAKPNKLTCEVLKPILHKYGYKLDLMAIHRVGEEKNANLKSQINDIDGDRLVVQTKEEVKEWGIEPARQKKRGGGDTLDEITNRVFEDLLKGKLEQNFDELGVLDVDARSSRTDNSNSDRSSSATGGFGIRSSAPMDKELPSKQRKPGHRSSVHDSRNVMLMEAYITKRRPNNNNSNNTPNNNDELYEGLKRAQRSRIDDQRGTEINFELPDFLKNDQPEDKENQLSHHHHHHHLSADQLLLARLDCSFPDSAGGGGGGIIPSHQQAEEYFSMAHPEVWGGNPPEISPSGGHSSANATLMASELDLDDEEGGGDFDKTLVAEALSPQTSSSLLMDGGSQPAPPPPPPSRMISPSLQLSPPPPPLPPKPKLGGAAMRGPPPRPPSRQLPLLNPPAFSSSTSDEDALHVSSEPPPPPPLHLAPNQRQQQQQQQQNLHHHHHHHHHHDKYNISFV